MKKIGQFIRKNIIGFIIGGIIFGSIGVYAATIAGSNITYSGKNSGLSATNVQAAIDEIYNKYHPLAYFSQGSIVNYKGSWCYVYTGDGTNVDLRCRTEQVTIPAMTLSGYSDCNQVWYNLFDTFCQMAGFSELNKEAYFTQAGELWTTTGYINAANLATYGSSDQPWCTINNNVATLQAVTGKIGCKASVSAWLKVIQRDGNWYVLS